MRVLIVDDSRAMRRILKKIVEGIGGESLEAGDGLEALAQLEQVSEPVDLALVDWNMPEMNGLEFVETVRSMPEYQPMRLVMVTTETEPSKMARALMAGADEFVMKPFTSEILLEKLRLIGVQGITSAPT